jgi:hypothetical protein
MLFGPLEKLEGFTGTFLAQLPRTFEVTNLRTWRGSDRQNEGEVKFGLQFSLTHGIPSILILDCRQEVVGNFVTERPLIRQSSAGGFDKRVKCMSLLVDGKGQAPDVKKLCAGRDVLV